MERPYDLVMPKVRGDFGWNDDYPEWWTLDERSDLSYTNWTTSVVLQPITPHHRIVERRALETIARYFRREFHFDFVQYVATEKTDWRDRAFAIVASDWGESWVLGGFVLRWRTWDNHPHGLALAWVWLHPYLRRHGIMRYYWPLLRRLYGKFDVEGPLSRAMAGFLATVEPTSEEQVT